MQTSTLPFLFAHLAFQPEDHLTGSHSDLSDLHSTMCLGLLCVPCYNCYQNAYSSKALFEKSKPPYWAVSNGENLRSLDVRCSTKAVAMCLTMQWRTYKLEGLKDITPFRAILEALRELFMRRKKDA